MSNYASEYYGGGEAAPGSGSSASSTVDVETAAADPLSTTIDGVTVTNRSIQDKIAADRHAAANRAASHNTFGMSIRKVKPGGAVRF